MTISPLSGRCKAAESYLFKVMQSGWHFAMPEPAVCVSGKKSGGLCLRHQDMMILSK
jgi:hypothetical protein